MSLVLLEVWPPEPQKNVSEFGLLDVLHGVYEQVQLPTVTAVQFAHVAIIKCCR